MYKEEEMSTQVQHFGVVTGCHDLKKIKLYSVVKWVEGALERDQPMRSSVSLLGSLKNKVRSLLKDFVTFLSSCIWDFFLYYAPSLRSTKRYLVSLSPFMRVKSLKLFEVGLRISCIFFRACGEYRKSLYFARLLRIFFLVKFKRYATWHHSTFIHACMKANDFLRVCNAYYSLEDVLEPIICFLVGKSYLLKGEYDKALHYISQALPVEKCNPEILRYYGIVQALLKQMEEAKSTFEKRIRKNPNLLIPHQNLAARYDLYSLPKPTIEGITKSGSLQVYDQLNYIGEQMFLHGQLKQSMEAYHCALQQQKILKKEFCFPEKLVKKLKKYQGFDERKPSALLPIEWVTQIGHIGLLDTFLKIEYFNRSEARNLILLAPPFMVANKAYLALWRKYFIIIENECLIHELLPYQRAIGEGFIPFLHENGQIEPWTKVGAYAQSRWCQLKKEPLVSISDEDSSYGIKQLEKMGVPKGAWYTLLHVREASYHKEGRLGKSEHRNANIRNYIKAAQEITAAGGWVIRVGDRKMAPFPKMRCVIDYARSKFKNDRMDVFLAATAKLLIGTTSGFTTAVLSFGRPCILVNTISNDWQLWSNDTHFIPKMVYDYREKRFLSLSEMYLSTNRNCFINQDLVSLRKQKIVQNSAEEIAEAVRYKLEILKKGQHVFKYVNLLKQYRAVIQEEPHIFGGGEIVPTFLEQHPSLLCRHET